MNRLFHKFILAAEPAAFTFILQLCLQNPQKLLTDIRVMNRTGHLHAPPQIPCHQIRRGNIQFCLFSAPEAVNPGVLQIPSDDPLHMNIFCISGHLRANTADPPDDQMNFHAGVRRLLKAINHMPFRHRVGFDTDIAIASFFRFLINMLQHSLPNAGRRHQQFFVRALQIIHKHVAKKRNAVLTDLPGSRHQ